MALVISEAPHALDLTGGRVLGRGETANVDLSNRHEATYYDEGWLTIIDGSSPPPPPTPPESIQVAGSPFQTGQVIYYDGMEWVVLNPGDAGEVLMTHGVNAIPEWVPIDVSMFAFDPATQSELDVHAADTTAVHGIANTADILYKTLADAKGDIFVATAPDTLVRLPVGADNTFLKANSAQPLGMEWATVPAPDLTPYAPKASPVFTGTIGVPLYTLATRPAATVGAGKLVYITDAPSGQQLQSSDGTNWAASTMDLTALSASIPNKIAWEYPTGTDVVELYGLRTAAGFAVAQIDNLNTDTSAAWSVRSGDGTQQNVWSGTTWTLPGTGSYGRVEYQRPGWGLQDDQARMKVKGRNTAGFGTSAQIMAGFSNAAMTKQITAVLVANGSVEVWTEQIGTNTNKDTYPQATTGLTITANTYYWIELTRSGNSYTVTVYAADGTTVLWTANGTVPVANQGTVGAGQSLYPTFGLGRATTGGQDTEVDQVELYTQQPEARDLLVATTAVTSGTRTVKRLFGSYGSAALRSDFAQMVNIGLSQALQLPVFTLASRPSATGASGAAIYVSDATAGQKLQTSDGTTWSSVAVVLDALSASTPDKIAWEYPTGTDVAEVYGLRTAQGVVYANAFTEEFASGVSSAWINRGASGASWRTTGSSLEQAAALSASTSSVLTRGPIATTLRAVQRSRRTGNGWGPGTSFANGIAIYFDATHFIIAGQDTFGVMHIGKLEGGTAGSGNQTYTDLVTAQSGAVSSADPYYLRLIKNGTTYTLEQHNTDVITTPTATPQRTLTVTLTGADGIQYGGSGQAGVWMTGQQTNPTDFGTTDYYDRFSVDSTTNELREVLAAVTSVGGARSVRRVLGYDGGILTGGLPVDPDVVTSASRPAADQVQRGRLIFVSDAAAGQQWQVSDGSAWQIHPILASPAFTGTPTAPTPAALDNSTKLATTAYADRLAQQVYAINTQTGTAYTAVLADAGRVIEMNNAAAMTLTIPPNSAVAYPIGTRMRGVRLGAGALTIAQGAGVVLRNKIEAAGTTNRTIPAQYGEWQLYKRATDEWVLTGDIA